MPQRFDLVTVGNYTKDTIVTRHGTRHVHGGGFNYAAHAARVSGLEVGAVTRLHEADREAVTLLESAGVTVFPRFTRSSTIMRLEYPTDNVDQRILTVADTAGSIEVGYITYSPALQRTRAATEAMYLMLRWAFDAGYRRYEWKCNALNAASRRAAQRLGLSYEGVFRQAVVVKGRNRDSAWYAAIDSEWPAIRAAMETWLDPANFDSEGVQRQSLSALTRPVLVATG